MDKDILDMFNLMIDKFDGMDKRLGCIEKSIAESETRIMVYVENNICKRLDALTDGYIANYEKNNEIELQIGKINEKVDSLETRVTLLENAG